MHIPCNTTQKIHHINDAIFSRGDSLLDQLFLIKTWSLQDNRHCNYCAGATKYRYEQRNSRFWRVCYGIHWKNKKYEIKELSWYCTVQVQWSYSSSFYVLIYREAQSRLQVAQVAYIWWGHQLSRKISWRWESTHVDWWIPFFWMDTRSTNFRRWTTSTWI